MAHNTLYFPFLVPPATGGDFVTIDHITALNQLGFDAKVLYLQADLDPAKFTVPVARLPVRLESNDIIVVGEVHRQIFEQLRGIDCVKVMHNQNPYYTFASFDTVQHLNDYPLSYIITPSLFTRTKLADMGVKKPIHCVRPFIPSYFAPGIKRVQIAYSPNKRPIESHYVMGRFRSQFPEFAAVPWLPLTQLSRQACAQIMAQAAIYAGFPHLEGLGLMSLEAMASGCQVVGYTAGGGTDYATPDNGCWIDEGDHERFILRLSECCQLALTSAPNPHLGKALETARDYSRKNFEAQLAQCYLEIMGPKVHHYGK